MLCTCLDRLQETGQYYNFSNIRYAAPPLGNLRFGAPIAPQTKNRTINDGQISTICPQASPAWELIAEQFLSGVPIATLINESSTSTLSLADIPKAAAGTSEDCLFLDVMVPEKIFNSPRAKKKRGEVEECDCDEYHNGGEHDHAPKLA